MIATEKEAHIAEALGLMLNQDKAKPLLEALLSAYIGQVQVAEDALFDLYYSRFIDLLQLVAGAGETVDVVIGDSGVTAGGDPVAAGEATAVQAQNAQLDILGRIVGQPRNGMSDEIYRLWIKARILINRSWGSAPQILEVLRLATGEDPLYHLVQMPPAAFELWVNTSMDDENAQAVASIVQSIKAAGVRSQTTWSPDVTTTFKLSSQSGTVETSSTRGLADETQTSGGHLRGVV